MDLQKRIKELENDFTSGGSAIAKKGLEIFFDALNTDNSYFQSFRNLEKLRDEIIKAKPTMSALRNVVDEALELAKEEKDATNIKSILIDKMLNETSQCIELAREKISGLNARSICTCSFSNTVLKLFESLKENDYIIKVLAYESFWNGRDYSEQMVEECIKIAVDAKKIYRSELNNLKIDIGIIGADSVIAGKGIVNGVPSFEFAKMLKMHNVGLYVIAESFKRSNEIHLSDGFEFVPNEFIEDIFLNSNPID